MKLAILQETCHIQSNYENGGLSGSGPCVPEPNFGTLRNGFGTPKRAESSRHVSLFGTDSVHFGTDSVHFGTDSVDLLSWIFLGFARVVLFDTDFWCVSSFG